MILAERETQLATLDKLLNDSLQGRGQVAVIGGPPGSGKTALMQAIAERGAGSGAIFLRAAASRAEGTLPLAVLGQIFRRSALPDTATERAAQLLDHPALIARLHNPDPETVDRVAAGSFEMLCTLLLGLSAKDPLIICIDDIQYADVPSLQFLSYFSRRMAGSRILLVISECFQLSADPLLHADVLRQPNCHYIRVDPLSPAAVAAVIAGHLSQATARHLATACYAVSGGSPLILNALIEDYRTAAHDPAHALVFGRALDLAVSTVLLRCEPTVMEVAKAIAVLEDTPSPAALGEVLGISLEVVAQCVGILTSTRLLEAGRFRHDAIRAVVLRTMSAEDRAGMHRHVARILRDHGATAPILARHLIAADWVEIPEHVALLQEAAEEMLADGKPGPAVAYLKRAHEECTDPGQGAMIQFTRLRAEWRLDPASAARHLPDLVQAVRKENLGPEQAVALLFYLRWHGRLTDAAEIRSLLGRRACPDAAPPPHEPSSVPAHAHADDQRALHLWANYFYPELCGRPEGGKGSPARVSATPPGTPAGLDAAMLEGSRPDDYAVLSITASLVALVCAEQPNSAASLCDAVLEQAGIQGSPTWQAMLRSVYAIIEIRRGNLPDAEGHARSALSLLTRQGWGVAIGVPLAALLIATTARGKYKAAEECLEIPVPREMFQTSSGLLYLHARGLYYMAVDRLHRALSDFQSCGKLMTSWRLDMPALVPWRSEAARVHVIMDRKAEARRMVEEQLALLTPRQSRARGISLRALALASEPWEQLDLLRQAVELLRESGDRLELAYAFADLTKAHQRLGEHRWARTTSRLMREIAEECGAEPLKSLSDVKNAVPSSAHDPKPLASLSEAERRVAALAVHGYTNRQIAQKLHLTVSTVEQHLTATYRKLRVRRRTDLPADLRLVLQP